MGISGALKFACSLVTPVRASMPVFSLRSTTLAPGTTEPEASLTATVIVRVSSWAGEASANSKSALTKPVILRTFLYMGNLSTQNSEPGNPGRLYYSAASGSRGGGIQNIGPHLPLSSEVRGVISEVAAVL